MPRPIRPSTSRATTPRRSSRSWRASPSAPRSIQSAVYVEGISSITPEDLAAADELGYRVKLLGVAVKTEKGIEQRVHPTMVPKETADRAGDGRDQCGHRRCRGDRADHAGRSRRRRAWRPPRRSSPTSATSPAACARRRSAGRRRGWPRSKQGADAAPRGRLLYPAARARPAGHRRHHRQAAGAAEHLARIDRAAPPRRARRTAARSQACRRGRCRSS